MACQVCQRVPCSSAFFQVESFAERSTDLAFKFGFSIGRSESSPPKSLSFLVALVGLTLPWCAHVAEKRRTDSYVSLLSPAELHQDDWALLQVDYGVFAAHVRPRRKRSWQAQSHMSYITVGRESWHGEDEDNARSSHVLAIRPVIITRGEQASP